jgi:hypothetical protein
MRYIIKIPLLFISIIILTITTGYPFYEYDEKLIIINIMSAILAFILLKKLHEILYDPYY